MTFLPHPRNTKDANPHRQEVREARKVLKERIRNDWDYPALPAFQRLPHRRKSSSKTTEDDGDDDRRAGFRIHADSNHKDDRKVDTLRFEPTEWRERECSSDSDSDTAAAAEGIATPSSTASKKSSSEYRFEGPDSVGVQISDRRTARKRKRQNAVDEELAWNDGLAHWMHRRDAWCCARSSAQVHTLQAAVISGRGAGATTSASPLSPSSSSSTTTSADSSPRSSTSSTLERRPPSSSAATTPDLPPTPAETTISFRPPSSSTPAPTTTILVPVAPPILPNHPIRRRITPSMYTEIYTKIILQARMPSVPINLRTLISALVEGWKEEGEWPPKSSSSAAVVPTLEPSLARRKHQQKNGAGEVANGDGGGGGGLKSSVKAVGRALGLTGVSEMGSSRQTGRD